MVALNENDSKAIYDTSYMKEIYLEGGFEKFLNASNLTGQTFISLGFQMIKCSLTIQLI